MFGGLRSEGPEDNNCQMTKIIWQNHKTTIAQVYGVDGDH